MPTRLLPLFVLLAVLAACATTPQQPVRIDGATAATFRASWAKLVSSLTSQQQAQLNTAVLLLGATKLHDSGYKGPPGFGPETLRTDLDGKSFDEVIAAAKATGARVTGVSHDAT